MINSLSPIKRAGVGEYSELIDKNRGDLTTRLKLLEVKKRDNMISKYNNHWRIRCEYLLEE